MAEDLMRYDLMVERALRTVVREAMARVADGGLPGEHHLYITFRTREPGVTLPSYLTERYPDEMTIVLQHQFEDLAVDEGGFSVSLNFNNVQEHLRVPFAAITAFADPSANFGLQFKFEEAEDATPGRIVPSEAADGPESGDDADAEPVEAGAPEDSKVVTLDTFRKK
jgi:hypothetical protein